MARLPDGSDQALVEVKAVDGAYPLYGTFEADPDQPLSTLLADKDGDLWCGRRAPAARAARTLRSASELLLGNTRLRITGTVKTEPDALSEGFGFAPRLLISRDALVASGLIRPEVSSNMSTRSAWTILPAA